METNSHTMNALADYCFVKDGAFEPLPPDHLNEELSSVFLKASEIMGRTPEEFQELHHLLAFKSEPSFGYALRKIPLHFFIAAVGGDDVELVKYLAGVLDLKKTITHGLPPPEQSSDPGKTPQINWVGYGLLSLAAWSPEDEILDLVFGLVEPMNPVDTEMFLDVFLAGRPYMSAIGGVMRMKKCDFGSGFGRLMAYSKDLDRKTYLDLGQRHRACFICSQESTPNEAPSSGD